MKKCRACGELKNSEAFGAEQRNTDGLRSYCRACIAGKRRDYAQRIIDRNRTNPPLVDGKKKCTECRRRKQKSEFHYCASNKDGRNTKCKSCVMRYRRKWITKIVPSAPKQKQCPTCKRALLTKAFCKSKQTLDGLNWQCRRCHGERVKKLRSSESYKEKKREYERNESPKNKLHRNIRRSLITGLEKHGLKKTKRLAQYGINVDAIYKHLGPRPSSHHHLDHIFPSWLFDHTNPLMIELCWRPENLRWIKSKDNLKKNGFFTLQEFQKYALSYSVLTESEIKNYIDSHVKEHQKHFVRVS